MYTVRYKETNEIIDCRERKIDYETNKTDSLSFVLYEKSNFYGRLKEYISKVVVYDDEEKIFDGQVVLVCDKMSENGEFYQEISCLGKLNYLARTLTGKYDIHPGNYKYTEEGADIYYQILENSTVSTYIEQMLSNHNIKVEKENDKDKIFNIGYLDVEDRLTRRTNRETVLEELQDLAENHNGIIVLTEDSEGNNYLDFRDSVDYTPEGPELAKGVNICNFERKNTLGCKISRLYPEGKDNLNIASVNTENNHENFIVDERIEQLYGVYEETHKWEDVTLPKNLLDKAKKYLETRNNNNYSIECKAVDLGYIDSDFTKLRINQVCSIWIDRLGVYEKYRLTKLSLDLDKPWDSNLGFGKNLYSRTRQAIKSSKEIQRKIRLISTSTNEGTEY